MKPLRAAAILTLLLAVAGCTSEPPRVAGCTVPANEDRLLDEYASDPVLAVRPGDAKRVGKVGRRTGCVQVSMEDVSTTSVTAQYEMSTAYGPAALRDAYATALAKRDWRADEPPPGPSWSPESIYLMFCRPVSGVTSV